MKIKKLKEDPVRGYSEYATLRNRNVQQRLSLNQTYTFTHKGVGEGITILYTGSISITNITVDGNVLVDASIRITANPVFLGLDWDNSISVTIRATAASNLFILYEGT